MGERAVEQEGRVERDADGRDLGPLLEVLHHRVDIVAGHLDRVVGGHAEAARHRRRPFDAALEGGDGDQSDDGGGDADKCGPDRDGGTAPTGLGRHTSPHHGGRLGPKAREPDDQHRSPQRPPLASRRRWPGPEPGHQAGEQEGGDAGTDGAQDQAGDVDLRARIGFGDAERSDGEDR
jgi:hypothetical protein